MHTPELRKTATDVSVTDFSIATTERWKSSKTGEERSETNWIKVVCWNNLAETVTRIIGKGDLVYVEGKITSRVYEKDGKQYTAIEVKADNVLIMESKNKQFRQDESDPDVTE